MENKKLKSYRKENKIKLKNYYFSKEKNVFKYIIYMFKDIFHKSSPLYATGTHIINGYPGAGKTLLMNKIINNVDSSKYFFYSNVDEFNQDNVYKINLKDLFDDKKQVARLKTKRKGKQLYAIIFDEINLAYNKRDNCSADYKNTFIGLIEFIVTHRHQGIPRIYFIGQKLELQDTQLISLFKYQHDIIRTHKPYRYWKYYKDYIQRVPVKLKVSHRVKSDQDIFTDWKREKVKIYWYDLETYDTFALGKSYKKLPLLK